MRKHKFLLSTLAALILATTTHAAPVAPPVPLLWKVSDADNSVYMLGSFHLLKPGDYPLSKDTDAAFEDAESLVFEIPPEEISSPALAMQMAQAALRTDGTSLDSALSPALTSTDPAAPDRASATDRTACSPASPSTSSR